MSNAHGHQAPRVSVQHDLYVAKPCSGHSCAAQERAYLVTRAKMGHCPLQQMGMLVGRGHQQQAVQPMATQGWHFAPASSVLWQSAKSNRFGELGVSLFIGDHKQALRQNVPFFKEIRQES